MGEITGRKVLLFCVGAFGIIIAVNLTLAWQAVRTFPGLEVENSYVASQSFDRDRAAQLALGWDVSADYDAAARELLVRIDGPDGQTVRDVANLTALVGWATSTRDDFTPDFTPAADGYVAKADLEPGNWNVRLRVLAANGTEFRQRIPLRVRPAG